MQVPLPFVNGIVAFVLTLISYMGAILSVMPPLLLALLDSPAKAGGVVALFPNSTNWRQLGHTYHYGKVGISASRLHLIYLLRAFGLFFGFLGLIWALPILIGIQIGVKKVLIKYLLDRWQTAPLRKQLDNP